MSRYTTAHQYPDRYAASSTEVDYLDSERPGVIAGHASRTGLREIDGEDHAVYRLDDGEGSYQRLYVLVGRELRRIR